MKRKFNNKNADNYSSQSQLITVKRRKLNNYNTPNSTCNNVHKMKLHYASAVDRIKYDKCPKCLTLNNYESMHFIYACISCSYFVCNFCMGDLYNYNCNRKMENKLIIKNKNKNKISRIKSINTEVDT
eukprot:383174_1